MDTGFLSTWQGTSVVLIGMIFILIMLVVLIKNLPKLKGVQIGKGGITFGTTEEDLIQLIPKIDRQCQLALTNIVIGMQDTLRASLNVSDFTDDPKDARIIKMLLTKMIMMPLFSSINRNHLAKRLSIKGRDAWLAQMVGEVQIQFNILQDYCDVKFESEGLLTQCKDLIQRLFMESAVPILVEAVHEKQVLYQRMSEGEKKTALIQKCETYLRGLDEL